MRPLEAFTAFLALLAYAELLAAERQLLQDGGGPDTGKCRFIS